MLLRELATRAIYNQRALGKGNSAKTANASTVSLLSCPLRNVSFIINENFARCKKSQHVNIDCLLCT
jgi:hypothetical protein